MPCMCGLPMKVCALGRRRHATATSTFQPLSRLVKLPARRGGVFQRLGFAQGDDRAGPVCADVRIGRRGDADRRAVGARAVLRVPVAGLDGYPQRPSPIEAFWLEPSASGSVWVRHTPLLDSISPFSSPNGYSASASSFLSTGWRGITPLSGSAAACTLSALLLDPRPDASVTRRRQPCWLRKQSPGDGLFVAAINGPARLS